MTRDKERENASERAPEDTVLPPRFQRLRTLGRGGMGVVHAAYDRERRMPVAVKHLYRVDGARVYRFKREFRALRDISHANIVQLYELVSAGDEWFLTMEIIDGVDFVRYVRGIMTYQEGESAGRASEDMETSRWHLAKSTRSQLAARTLSSDRLPGGAGAMGAPRRPGQRPWQIVDPRDRPDIGLVLELERARPAFAQLADALTALHRVDVIHRDLKPSNVMVTEAGRVVLMDFGMVAELRMAMDERAGAVLGTPLYMAPEQAVGAPVSPAADWYAFGVMLYEALTGRTPQTGSALQLIETKQTFELVPPSQLVKDVPADLEELCLALLEQRPEDRPTGDEVCRRLLGVNRSVVSGTIALPGGRADPDPEADDVFVGREAELAQLARTFEDVLAGAARTVLVRGPSGIGKTRLLHQFSRQAMSRAARAGKDFPLMVTGRCHEWESMPYKAFDSVVDELCLHLLDMLDDERAEIMPTHMGALARLFPVLSKLPEMMAPDMAIESQLEPTVLKARARTALRELLHALARWRPVLIQVEDFHWADIDSQELLASIMRPPVAERLMVVVSVRAEREHQARVDAIRAELERHTEPVLIELAPLAGAEEAQLIARIRAMHQARRAAAEPGTTRDGISPDEHPFASQWARTLLSECAGHPLLLRETLRFTLAAVERGDQVPASGELSLEGLIWRRIRALPESSRALIVAAGLAGEPAPLWMVSEVAGLGTVARERAFMDLRQRHLLRITRTQPEPWVDVFHDKVRESVMQRVSPWERALLHRGLAEAMVREAAPSARIAAHFLAAGERMAAVRHFLAAARAAREQLAFAGALHFFEEAQHALSARVVRPDDGGAGRDAGDDEDGIERMRVRLHLEWASTLRAIDRSDDALVQLDLAEPGAERLSMLEELAELHYLRGSLLFPRGDMDGCLREHIKARSLARRAGSVVYEARALSGLGDARFLAGQVVAARRLFEECLAVCGAHGLESLIPSNLGMRGLARFLAGEAFAGLDDAQRALALAMDAADTRAEVIIRTGCMSFIESEFLMLDRAVATMERGMELARAIEAPRFQVMGLGYLAMMHRYAGRREESQAYAERALALCHGSAMLFLGPVLHGIRAWTTRDAATRREALAEGHRLIAQRVPGHSYLLFLRYAIDTAIEWRAYHDVEPLLERLERYPREMPRDWRDLWVARARALVAVHTSGRSAESLARARAVRDEALTRGYKRDARALTQVLEDDGS